MSNGWRLRRRTAGDEIEQGVVEVSERELLLGDVCWSFEEEDRRAAVLKVCEYERKKAAAASSWAETGRADAEGLFCGGDDDLK